MSRLLKQNTPGHRIKELYAFVAIDEDGDEGIMGMQTGDTWMPLIGSDMPRVESLKPIAEEISRQTNTPYEIRHFKPA